MTQEQLLAFTRIMSNSLLISELTEQTSITTDSNYIAINSGTNDAKKVKIPLLRGYQGDWDASTNTPTLANGVGVSGDIYRVSVGGTLDLGNGSATYVEEDIIFYNGTRWLRIAESSSDDKHFQFNQTSASTDWTISHALDKYPSVTVVDSAGTEVEGVITYIDSNNLSIEFSSAFSGKAYLN